MGLSTEFAISSTTSAWYIFLPLMGFFSFQSFSKAQSIAEALPPAVQIQRWAYYKPCHSSASLGGARSQPAFRHGGGFGRKKSEWQSSTLDAQGRQQVIPVYLGINIPKGECEPRFWTVPTEQPEQGCTWGLQILLFNVTSKFLSNSRKRKSVIKC